MPRKKSNSRSRTWKPRNKRQLAQRITSYTAAAGLGAFAFGEAADGAIIYVDVPDIVVNETNPTGGYFDMNGDAIADFRFRFQPSGGAAARIRFQGVYGSADLTNSPAKGSTYYVRSFELGDLIGPGTPAAAANGLVRSDSTNFGNPTDPQYAGIALLIGRDTHYGWLRMKTEPIDPITGAAAPPLTGTIFDWAYESVPDTAIAAGAPEPSSLALLAAGAGAGAFGLRRRRRSA